MIPVWSMVIGVCVGLAVLMLTRPRPLAYDGNINTRQSPHAGAGNDTGRRQKFHTKPGDKCVICLMEMWNDLCYMRCGHALHENCVMGCKNLSNKCPICRETM